MKYETQKPTVLSKKPAQEPTSQENNTAAADSNETQETDGWLIQGEYYLPVQPSTLTDEDKKRMDETLERAKERNRRNMENQSSVVVNQPKTESGMAYSERLANLNSSAPSHLEAILSRVRQNIRTWERPHEMTYDDARIVVEEILLGYLKRKNRRRSEDADTLKIYEDVTRYFIGDPTGPIPLHKGLYIYGGVGVGKTILMDVMRDLCQFVPLAGMSFLEVISKPLVRACSDAKSLTPIKQYEQGNLLIDDLGDEKDIVGIWGNAENPIDELLTVRYRAFQRFNLITHVTSNLDPAEDIIGRYKTRMNDRFSEMFEPIFFPGESKR